jgi:hypothetical protein
VVIKDGEIAKVEKEGKETENQIQLFIADASIQTPTQK